MNRFVFALTLAAALAAHAAERQLATVLPFDASRAKLERDQRTILEEAIRTSAGDALAPAGITVLTSETQLKLLEDNGIDTLKCADATCHLDTAREMKATYFISGVIAKEEDELVAFIRMFDTVSGRQLASMQVEGKTPKDLRKAFSAQAGEFFKRAGFGADQPTNGGGGGGTGFLTVLTNPPAEVLVDGVLAGTAPVRRRVVNSGSHTVTLRVEGYPTLSKTVGIEQGKELTIEEKLQKAQGFLEIKVIPADAKVFVDGLAAGAGRQGPFAVGRRVVRAEAPGFRAAEQTIELKDGMSFPVAISLEAMPARVVVTTNVEADCAVDDASFKATPGAAVEQVVAVGTRTVTCRARGYTDASASFTAIAGQAFPVALVLEKRALPPAGATVDEEKTGYTFVSIPGGEFTLGCVKGDSKCFRDEAPKKVTVQPLLLGRTEVTVAAYAKCVDANVCRPPNDSSPTCTWGRRPDHPVNCVDAMQASTFCRWIGGRLPSATEWEYAAKGGAASTFPWGNERPGAYSANYCDSRCAEADPDLEDVADEEFDDGWAATAPVGSFPRGATKWGLLDMAGNVWEWTATAYDQRRAEIRGGAWNSMVRVLRASVRSQLTPTKRNGSTGFRCAQ